MKRYKPVYYYPGTGTDCETCGYTGDLLSFWVEDDGSFELLIDVGCTGGASEYEDIDRAIDLAQQYRFVPEKIQKKVVKQLTRLKEERERNA